MDRSRRRPRLARRGGRVRAAGGASGDREVPTPGRRRASSPTRTTWRWSASCRRSCCSTASCGAPPIRARRSPSAPSSTPRPASRPRVPRRERCAFVGPQAFNAGKAGARSARRDGVAGAGRPADDRARGPRRRRAGVAGSRARVGSPARGEQRAEPVPVVGVGVAVVGDLWPRGSPARAGRPRRRRPAARHRAAQEAPAVGVRRRPRRCRRVHRRRRRRHARAARLHRPARRRRAGRGGDGRGPLRGSDGRRARPQAARRHVVDPAVAAGGAAGPRHATRPARRRTRSVRC